MTYTYRTHDKEDTEAKPYRIAGSTDLKIDTWKGRWMFYIPRHPSNTVELKIDKRSQLVGKAEDWADYVWTYHPEWGIAHPSGLWSRCQPFVAYIYSSHGMKNANGNSVPPADGNSQAQLDVATSVDTGPGALRFFWTFNSNKTSPSHTAMIGRNGQRIDTNGPHKRTYTDKDGVTWPNGYNGPSVAELDYGIAPNYTGDNPDFEGHDSSDLKKRPRSTTLPGDVPNSGKSLLEELDAE